eukprot:11991149-Alexandrium_andersonii.AAC.1
MPRREPTADTFDRNAAHGAASVQKHAGSPPCINADRVISSTSRFARSATALSLDMSGWLCCLRI